MVSCVSYVLLFIRFSEACGKIRLFCLQYFIRLERSDPKICMYLHDYTAHLMFQTTTPQRVLDVCHDVLIYSICLMKIV
jgi:hypothetical protein